VLPRELLARLWVAGLCRAKHCNCDCSWNGPHWYVAWMPQCCLIADMFKETALFCLQLAIATPSGFEAYLGCIELITSSKSLTPW
jgi:hypothetical protein